MKNIILLLLLFLCINIFAQSYMIYENKSWTILTNYQIDSLGNEEKTYITNVHSGLGIVTDIQIFTINNNCLHGNCYLFSSSGEIKTWLIYKNGRIWEYTNYSHKKDYGHINKGYGYLNSYWALDSIGMNFTEYDRIISRVYYNKGVPVYEEIYDNKGEVQSFGFPVDTSCICFNNSFEVYSLERDSSSSDTNIVKFNIKSFSTNYLPRIDTTFHVYTNLKSAN